MYTDTYDKRSEESREEIRTIKTSGISAIFCGVLRVSAIIVLAILGSVSLYISGSPFDEILDFLSANIFPIFEIGVGILLLFILLKGLRIIVRRELVGQKLLALSVTFLIIFLICIPIQLIFLSDVVAWDPLGVFTPYLSKILANYISLTWFLFTTLSFLGFSITFGILLVKLDAKIVMRDLKLPAIFLLIQSGIPISQIMLVFSLPLAGDIFAFAILFAALATFGYILLGIKLLRIY